MTKRKEREIQELKEELERTRKELLDIKRAVEILKEKNWK